MMEVVSFAIAVYERGSNIMDKCIPHAVYRWMGSLGMALVYGVRVYYVGGFSIVISSVLGFYFLWLLNVFLSPLIDPLLDFYLPTKSSDDSKPFIRRLPEFKFWFRITTAFPLAFLTTFFFPMFHSPPLEALMVGLLWRCVVLFILFQAFHMIWFKYNPFGFELFKKIKYGGTKAAASNVTTPQHSST